MKTLIVSLNSKYIHSSLASWYLKSSCGSGYGEVRVLEFTINDSPDSVLASIYRENADITAFSCYIWNIGHVYKLAENLKKVRPDNIVILGGPEVSFDAEDVLMQNDSVDFVISGEGEYPFSMLLNRLYSGDRIKDVAGIPGLISRGLCGIVPVTPVITENLDSIPTPYTDEMLEAAGDRIVYYESSRGCPFSCTYCLSSTCRKVRYFSMDRVKRELERFFDAGIGQVKFVDRTFNFNKERAMAIFRHIIGLYLSKCKPAGKINDSRINFHFEAAADLFDDEMLELLESAPAGLIRMEIGVQSVNESVLKEVERKTDIAGICENVSRLRRAGNIHIHLDLIAGLPYEDMESFRRSFDRVYGMKPDMLQLGFLKVLKGTKIRRDAGKHGYRYRNYPPYEILYNSYIGFDEILELKGMEDLVGRYYNSGRFVKTLDYLTNRYFGSAFDFFRAFNRFSLETGRKGTPAALKELYGALYCFAASFADGEGLSAANEFMKLDFLASDSSGCLPPVLIRDLPDGFRDICFGFLKDRRNIERYLPEFTGLPAKEIYKKVHFEPFSIDITQTGYIAFSEKPLVLLFDYSSRDRVSGLFHYDLIYI